VPSGGSVSADVGSSLLRLGGSGALLIGGCAVLVLVLRWLTRELLSQRARRRRRRALPRHPEHQPSPALAQRRARHPSAHHSTGQQPAVAPATGPRPAARPRRPIEVVAADLRRLTGELAVVPGGGPIARRSGLLAAYDDVLVEAAELLEVPERLTTQPPATRELERRRLLALLEARGLVVGD
jgi:hypothetical protein